MSSPSGNLLREFKGDLRAPLPLHPLEKALIVVVALNVCSLPWMLGGMRPWAQFISLGLSLAALIMALVPRNYDGDLVRGESYRMQPIKRLLRWPLFWIGLVFFGYVLIQALNPAWEFVQMENSWGMRKIDHVAWLPTGMSTPFEMMNPWRQMMIWGAPFLLICALWMGFTRRKSVITLLTLVVGNAVVLAVLGIAARLTGGRSEMLWILDSPTRYHFATIIYKNHAGSFFALAVGLALSLAVWHSRNAARRMQRSSPAGLFIICSFVLLIALLQTYSRAAILISGVFLTVFCLIGLKRFFSSPLTRQHPAILILILVGFSAFAVIGTNLVNSDLTRDRILSLADMENKESSVWRREVGWELGWEMANEKPALGWGAGGFRFLFPLYQVRRDEALWQDPVRKRGRLFWEHMHNDYIQTLIEVGRVGASLIGIGLVFAIVSFFRARGFRNIVAVSMAGAAAIPMIHAAVDFPLQNPAVLLSFTVAGALTLILTLTEVHPSASKKSAQRHT